MTKPIPDGYHAVTPHIIVRNGAEALEFYAKAFGAKESFRMPTPDGKGILHAEFTIDGSPVMLAEENPSWDCKSPLMLKGSPVTLHLYVKDVDTFFDRAVQAGCKPTMPVSDMFWGDRYGKLEDPFGHQWSIATHVEDVPPEEMAARGEKAMREMAG